MTINTTQISDWQDELRQAVTDPKQLLQLLDLSTDLLSGALAGDALFGLKVPHPFLKRMHKGDPNDPLLRQVLPLAAEQEQHPGFSLDPLGEAAANRSQGLIHKYRNRILLILSGACAINCRYCFRRHFAYGDNQLGKPQWQRVLEYIQKHPQVDEVIFSGGDPLATSDARLAALITSLADQAQIRRLRIHTRLPVVIPQRVNDGLIQALTATRLQPIMVLHINHPQEIDDQVVAACQRLRAAGVLLLNQAVLLRGINDSLTVQKTLSETLFEAGIIPYYLFLFDPVAGAAHFDTDATRAQQLLGELQAALPGYLVPRLARELPGQPAKTLLAPIVEQNPFRS